MSSYLGGQYKGFNELPTLGTVPPPISIMTDPVLNVVVCPRTVNEHNRANASIKWPAADLSSFISGLMIFSLLYYVHVAKSKVLDGN